MNWGDKEPHSSRISALRAASSAASLMFPVRLHARSLPWHTFRPSGREQGRMRKIEESDRVVVNETSAQFHPFVSEGREVPGQSYLQLDETFPPGCGFHLYRMAPGSSSQPHEHTCREQFLVLDGEVI